MIKDVNEAWQVLGDKEKRAKYDAGEWDFGTGGGGGGMHANSYSNFIF